MYKIKYHYFYLQLILEIFLYKEKSIKIISELELAKNMYIDVKGCAVCVFYFFTSRMCSDRTNINFEFSVKISVLRHPNELKKVVFTIFQYVGEH